MSERGAITKWWKLKAKIVHPFGKHSFIYGSYSGERFCWVCNQDEESKDV